MSLYVTSKELGLPIEIREHEVQAKDRGTGVQDFKKERATYVYVNITCRQWSKVVVPTAIAAGAGAIAGGAAGFVLAGPPGIVPGAMTGMVVAGGISAVTSTILVFRKVPSLIMVDPKYHEWRAEKQRNNLLEIFDISIREHNSLMDLYCPISADFPRVPVRAPCGHVYDKISIEKHLDSVFSAKSCCSSLENVRFTKADLTFYPEHLINIMKTCIQVRTIMSVDISGKLEGRILREGLDVIYSVAESMSHQTMSIRISELMRTSRQPGVRLNKETFKKEVFKICEEHLLDDVEVGESKEKAACAEAQFIDPV